MVANYPAFYPLISHDINLDIPPQYLNTCKAAYRSWQLFICIGVLLDLVCSIVIASTTSSVFLNYFWYKLMYFFIIPPASFFCLYFSLYKALKLNHQFYWIVHGLSAVVWIAYLSLSMIGTVWKKNGVTMVDSLGDFYAFPGGESGFYGITYFFEIQYYTPATAALVARVFWFIALIFYIIQTRNVYKIYSAASATQTKIGAKFPEEAELGQIDRSRGQLGGVVNVNGRDVHVAVDSKTATSVASKAYSSGAAGELARGAKVDKNDNIVIDSKSAMNAAKAMHASGATSELAAGTTLSSGGYSTGGPATAGKGQYVKAIHDFAGGENGDLPLTQGDRVLVIRKIDANWYEGSFNGKTGIFPSKFVTNA